MGEGRVAIENVGGENGHEKEEGDEANQKISNHSSSKRPRDQETLAKSSDHSTLYL